MLIGALGILSVGMLTAARFEGIDSDEMLAARQI